MMSNPQPHATDRLRRALPEPQCCSTMSVVYSVVMNEERLTVFYIIWRLATLSGYSLQQCSTCAWEMS
jgi:hypothetical protein